MEDFSVIEKYIGERREEPAVFYCGRDYGLLPGAHYGPVTRDVFIIECCTRGYGAIEINNASYPVLPGCCYFLMPGDLVTHRADEKEPREGYWCSVDGLQIASALKKAGISSTSPFAAPEAAQRIQPILKKLYDTRTENDTGADMRRTACIYEILGELLRTATATDKNVWVQKAVGYMEANYPSDISVASLAAEIGLDRSYFSTLFKEHTGISPHAYLISLRIRKAAYLIKEGSYTVADVAEAVGLDAQNFSRLFKRETGISPREYKKQSKTLDATLTPSLIPPEKAE